jgi:molybdopterin molybdotransferase
VRSSVSWDQARSLAHDRVTALPSHLVRLAEAVGCVLADDLVAESDLPPVDTSAMDGWAVNGPPPWRVVGEALAGRGCSHPAELAPSEAVVIATGARLPPGATGIVRSERGALAGTELQPTELQLPDLSDVRPRGHEAKAGDLLIRSGSVIRPTMVGLAAAAGHDALAVHPRPLVSVLVLGDELLDEGPPRGGAVRDALGVQLPSWVQALGGEPGLALRVADDQGTTLAAVRACESDVVMTTGGSAGGAADHLRGALARLGARIVVDTVDVRPGHPMLLAELPDGRRLVGLPGNPLAALAGVITLLAPLLAGLSGAPLPPLSSAVVEQDVSIHSRGSRTRGRLLIPVSRNAEGAVRPTGYSASAMLRGAALADGFLLVSPDGVQAGERGNVVWFPWPPQILP